MPPKTFMCLMFREMQHLPSF